MKHDKFENNRRYNTWREESGLMDSQISRVLGANQRTLRRYKNMETPVPPYFLLACNSISPTMTLQKIATATRDCCELEKLGASQR